MPHRIVAVILDQISIQGAQPVTLNSIRSLIADILASNDGSIASLSRGMADIVNRLNVINVGQMQTDIQQSIEQ